jgi:hypothetical protein
MNTAINPVSRWVVTVPAATLGWRTLAFPCQGRHTFGTQEEAEQWIRDYHKQGRYDALGADLKATTWPCYPGHFDPTCIYRREEA